MECPLNSSPEPGVSAPLLVRACRGEAVERTPVWAMRQAGRWDPEFMKLRRGREFYEFAQDAQAAAEASLLPRRFGVDGIILFYDITTLAIAMGVEFDLHPNRGPVPRQPIRTHGQAALLNAEPDPQLYRHVIEMLGIVRRAVQRELAVLVFASAPFTLASYCIGTGKNVDATREFVREQPVAWATLCDRIVQATASFLRQLHTSGADAYQLFDSWAGELTGPEYADWAQRYHRAIIAAGPNMPSILFVRECPYLDRMLEAGASVISLGVRHSLAQARRQTPTQVFQGNVDHDLLARGLPDQVHAATVQCLREGGGRHHVLNLNHGVDRITPVANFAAFTRASLL